MAWHLDADDHRIASLFDYATNPTGVIDPYPRTGYVVTVDGSDADGLVGRGWPIGVAPHVLDEEIGTGTRAP